MLCHRTGRGSRCTFPPVPLLCKVIQKLRTIQESEVILIAPWWPSQPWFPHLLQLCVDHPQFFQFRRDLLSQQGYVEALMQHYQAAGFSREVSRPAAANAGTPIPLDTHPPEHSSPWNTHPPGTLIPLELPSPWNTHPPWNSHPPGTLIPPETPKISLGRYPLYSLSQLSLYKLIKERIDCMKTEEQVCHDFDQFLPLYAVVKD